MPRPKPKPTPASVQYPGSKLDLRQEASLIASLLPNSATSEKKASVLREIKRWAGLLEAARKGARENEPAVRDVLVRHVRGSRQGRPADRAQIDAITGLRSLRRRLCALSTESLEVAAEAEFAFVLNVLNATGWKPELTESQRRKELRRLFRDERYSPRTRESLVETLARARKT